MTSWIELNRNAFNNNIMAHRRLLGSDTRITVVVKGNAYGHGLAKITQLCHEHPAVYGICTATLSEALSARQHMPKKFILVLCTFDADLHALVSHDIDMVVYDHAMLAQLNAIGKKNRSPINVHVKVDTGMGRFGFAPEEALTVVQSIKQFPGVKLRGICTHLAESSNKDQTFTLQQQNVFAHFLEKLDDTPRLIHSDNSAGTLHTQSNRCNMVRLGSSAYGLWPSKIYQQRVQAVEPTFDLQPVMTWKTRIMHIKNIPEQQPVGYDRSFVTQQKTRLAILPIGYWDGYDRKLSNKGVVRIRGTYAPVIGRVCMNVTLIDITEIPDARVGDIVILLGNHEKISAHAIAKLTGAAHREIVTRLNPLITRLRAATHLGQNA